MNKFGLIAALAVVSGAASAQITLSAKTSFSGDGWLAPGEVAGYNYLGTGNLERGLAYSNGKLILVSRSTAGNGIRVLNGETGVDEGALNQGTGIITGGTFTTNMAGADANGNIFVANLQTNVSTGNLRIYKWDSLTAAAPTVFFSGTVAGLTGTPRVGDSMDVDANGNMIFGFSGIAGYVQVSSMGVATGVTPITGTGSGDFRLGITYGDAGQVFGKQTGVDANAAPLRNTLNGALSNSMVLTTGGEMAMDYAVVNGFRLLATVDANSSIVRVYEIQGSGSSTTATLRSSLTTITGSSTGNGNAVGQVRFGAINGETATLYAMNTNNGIQAFEVNAVPEPATMAVLGLGALALIRRRRNAK